MEPSLEQMARLLAESGEYRVTSRLESLAEYHPGDDTPKPVAAVVDVETTGTNQDRDKIIELGICLFEYDRQSGQIYKVLGSWEWLEDPGCSIPPEITKITGITDQMVADQRIDDRAVDDLLDRIVLVIAHHADFDRRFLEKRIPAFASKHWAYSRFDIDWRQRVSVHLRSNSSLTRWVSFMTAIGLLAIAGLPSMRWHNGYPYRTAGFAGPLGTGEAADMAVMGAGRPIEKKDVLKTRGYSWSPGEFGRPKSWYRDVSDANKAAEVSRLRQSVMGPGQGIWALRITARDRYSNRWWGWGERLGMPLECAADRSEGRWSGLMKADVVREGPSGTVV